MAQELLQGVAGKLRFVNLDQDGVPAPAAGAVTVRVVRADGTEVLPAGSATTAGAGTGEYERALTAAQLGTLDQLTVTWTDAGDGSVHVTVAEVVGAFLFSVAQARASDPTFVDATYPTAEVVEVRALVEDVIESAVEQALGRRVAFVPRFRRAVLSGNGLDTVDLPDYFVRTIRSATITGEAAFTSTELEDLVAASGQMVSTLRTWTRGNRNVAVAYEHGMDGGPPIIQRAGLLLFRAWLPAFRSTSTAGVSGIKSLSVEGLSLGFDSPKGDTTGIAEVDRLISSWLAGPVLASVPT